MKGRLLPGLLFLAAGLLLFGQALWTHSPETYVVKEARPEVLRLTGTVSCEKTSISKPAGMWYPLVESGQRVAPGQPLYGSRPPAETWTQTPPQMATLRQEALENALSLVTWAEGTGRISGAKTLRTAVTGTAPAPEGLSGESRYVTAPEGGIFLRDHGGRTLGTLVTGETWYLTLSEELSLPAGDILEAELLSGIFRPVTLTVEATEPGKTVLSCEEYLPQAAAQEFLTLKIEKDTPSGLEIPARWVYTGEDGPGVWCRMGDSVRWKPVRVLARQGDTVIAALEGEDPNNLLPGDILLPERPGSDG